jgi:hypothetical protein
LRLPNPLHVWKGGVPFDKPSDKWIRFKHVSKTPNGPTGKARRVGDNKSDEQKAEASEDLNLMRIPPIIMNKKQEMNNRAERYQ